MTKPAKMTAAHKKNRFMAPFCPDDTPVFPHFSPANPKETKP